MDHRLDTKRKRFRICSACQSSFYFEPAVLPFRRLRSPAACGRRSSHLFVLPGSSSLLSQRNIPMKSAKNAMRLMWWPPSETVEEDQCCGRSQVPGLRPAVCLSKLPWWTPILSSVCLGRVFFFFLSPLLRLEGGEEGKKSEKEGRGEEGDEEGSFQGMHERKKMLEGKGREREREGYREGRKEGRVYWFAHRLRGLCVGPGVWFSGPLAFLCSLALEKTNTH